MTKRVLFNMKWHRQETIERNQQLEALGSEKFDEEKAKRCPESVGDRACIEPAQRGCVLDYLSLMPSSNSTRPFRAFSGTDAESAMVRTCLLTDNNGRRTNCYEVLPSTNEYLVSNSKRENTLFIFWPRASTHVGH